jgi:hypothetical protein
MAEPKTGDTTGQETEVLWRVTFIIMVPGGSVDMDVIVAAVTPESAILHTRQWLKGQRMERVAIVGVKTDRSANVIVNGEAILDDEHPPGSK